jgi:hypothetical protein
MNDPGDAAVYACTVITFYCVARLGEFTVPNIREKFEPMKYISRRDISMLKDKDGLPVIKFRIPVTKCDPSGEDVQCAPQPGCVTFREGKSRMVQRQQQNMGEPSEREHYSLYCWIYLQGSA